MNDQVIHFLESTNFGKFSSEIAYFIRPAVRIHKSFSTSGKKSHFGGLPDSMPNFQYPIFHLNQKIGIPKREDSEVKPSFLCQIYLNEIPSLHYYLQDQQKKEGVLYFFADLENNLTGWRDELSGSWKVIYLNSNNTNEDNPIIKNQDNNVEMDIDLDRDDITPFIEMRFETVWMFGAHEHDLQMISDLFEVNDLNFYELQKALQDQQHFNYYMHSAREAGSVSHQLFGYPGYIQNLMQEKCHEKILRKYDGEVDSKMEDWILLLQLDSDEDLNWGFGDSGILFFWIRKQDLKKLDFSDVSCIFQCA